MPWVTCQKSAEDIDAENGEPSNDDGTLANVGIKLPYIGIVTRPSIVGLVVCNSFDKIDQVHD